MPAERTVASVLDPKPFFLAISSAEKRPPSIIKRADSTRSCSIAWRETGQFERVWGMPLVKRAHRHSLQPIQLAVLKRSRGLREVGLFPCGHGSTFLTHRTEDLKGRSAEFFVEANAVVIESAHESQPALFAESSLGAELGRRICKRSAGAVDSFGNSACARAAVG